MNESGYRRVRETRECSSPVCSNRIPSDFVSCRVCWETVPENLRDAFYRSRGKPTRRDAWKRVERYLAIRARLRVKAVAQ